MSSSFNQVTLIGNLTRDPELKTIKSGTSVCNASIAINERFKQGDEWKDRVHYFDLVVWGRTGEIMAEYCAKGAQVCVSGSLAQESWTDKDTQQKRSKVVVKVDKLVLIGSKSGGNNGSARSSGDEDHSYETPPSNQTSRRTDPAEVPF